MTKWLFALGLDPIAETRAPKWLFTIAIKMINCIFLQLTIKLPICLNITQKNFAISFHLWNMDLETVLTMLPDGSAGGWGNYL